MASRVQAQKALEIHEQKLSGCKNVVGLGIVPADEESGSKDLAVAVYVKKKLPLSKLAKDQVVPETLPVPGRGKVVQVPTRVIEQDKVELEAVERV
ncbi:MAG TPA: hypothetical protein VFV87_04275 [Pirellulaceae bacterium]|nr:hypothetical protein [Pirellulaceae bacterium]